MQDDAPKHPVVDRLGPRSVERPGDAGFTAIGVLDDRSPAQVDRAGLVHEDGAGWSIDWWIGAEDRWYFPARETTVRQRRIGAGPVLETSVRIPGGDALYRTHRAIVRGLAATVIEVENATATPVAFALAVRPYDLSGSPAAAPTSIRVHADRVEVDGRVVAWLPRPPGDVSVSSDDPVRVLQAGRGLDGTAQASAASVHAVLVFPLPHRTKLRFVVVSGQDPVAIEPAAVSDHEAVARGWTAVVDGGGRFSLPDNGLSDRAAAARARLLLDRRPVDPWAAAQSGAGLVLEALATSGARHPVDQALEEFAESYPTRLASAADGAALAHALGWSACARGDVPRASSILEPLTQLTTLVERRRDSRATATALCGLAWACRATGRTADADRLFARANSTAGSEPVPLAEVYRLAERAGEAGSFGDDDLFDAARLWSAVRNLMLCETPTGIDMLAEFPAAWRGGNIEVHRAASPHGLLSYAVRWHGYRPALLWDLELSRGPVELRCSGLDPDWSTSEPRGEVLLIGTPEQLPDAPAPGDSFL